MEKILTREEEIEIEDFTEEHEATLQIYFAEEEAGMVLDDDMPDAYESWIVNQNDIHFLQKIVLETLLKELGRETKIMNDNLKRALDSLQTINKLI